MKKRTALDSLRPILISAALVAMLMLAAWLGDVNGYERGYKRGERDGYANGVRFVERFVAP